MKQLSFLTVWSVSNYIVLECYQSWRGGWFLSGFVIYRSALRNGCSMKLFSRRLWQKCEFQQLEMLTFEFLCGLLTSSSLPLCAVLSLSGYKMLLAGSLVMLMCWSWEARCWLFFTLLNNFSICKPISLQIIELEWLLFLEETAVLGFLVSLFQVEVTFISYYLILRIITQPYDNQSLNYAIIQAWKSLFHLLLYYILFSISIMSKPKGKDKKNDNIDLLQSQFQQQKRELLDATFTIRKLQQRLNDLTTENSQLREERDDRNLASNQKIEELSIKNQTNEKRLISMRNEITTAQVQNKKLTNTVSILQKILAEERQERLKQAEQADKILKFEKAKLQGMLTDYKSYMGERDKKQREIQRLTEQVSEEVAQRIRQVADKERERVQATDKIRDQMNNKIRQMQKDLRSLKKEELDTTTRLTMLQNHQLTSQLQYQTKQTQKIVFKNEQLQARINSLQQQLQIHKQVEDQLAKRAHFSKGIIKKLHLRVAQLESADKTDKKEEQSNKSLMGPQSIHKQKDTQKDPNEGDSKNLMMVLDKELQKSQKKYMELLTRYQNLKKQKQDHNNKFQALVKIHNQLYLLLFRYYNEIILQNPSHQSDANNIDDVIKSCHGNTDSQVFQLNLKKLRSLPIDKWQLQEIKTVMEIMLNLSQPKLVRGNIMIPALRRNLVVVDSDQQKVSLPKLPATERDRKHIFTGIDKNGSKSEKEEDRMRENDENKMSIQLATKIVTSKLREWGHAVMSGSRSNLKRKYKLNGSYRN